MLIKIRLIPGAHENAVTPQADGSLVVHTRARPIENAANTALTQLLCEYYDIPKSRITLRRGARSRYKVVEIL